MEKIRNTLLTLAIVMSPFIISTPVSAAPSCSSGSTCINYGDNNGPLSREEARQDGEQWNETKRLRQKVNNRTEKEFDKRDVAIDDKERCEKSFNLNAYWEPSTRRCLDVSTGHLITP